MIGEKAISMQGGHPAALHCFSRRAAAAIAGALATVLLLAGAPSSARADSEQLLVQAAVVSKSVCKFDTATATLAFGALDPAVTSNAPASATVPIVCRGSAPVAFFGIAGDDGLYPAGPGARRMRHATDPSAYLPYAMSVIPSMGFVAKNVPLDVTIAGTVYASDFQSAHVGSYSDTVILTLLP